MSGFQFRPATRENVGLLIGIVGASGSGKTFSAMRLASGICGDKPFAVIDTEAGRAKHYADQFKFDHGDLTAPFRPDAYAEAIKAADDAGYPVIVVDSASHEHAGDGGLLDWHEEELTRMAGDDWKRREACKMAAWIKPKGSHKKFVSKLLQVRAHLILCFRAEEKIEMVKGPDGKMQIVPKKSPVGAGGWVPICEKNLPYEMTASFLLTADAPGMPKPIKLQEQHKVIFPLDQPISEDSGKRIAEWGHGGSDSRQKDNRQMVGNTEQLNGTTYEVHKKDSSETFATPEEWADKMIKGIGVQKSSHGLDTFRNRNLETLMSFNAEGERTDIFDKVQGAFNEKMTAVLNAEREIEDASVNRDEEGNG